MFLSQSSYGVREATWRARKGPPPDMELGLAEIQLNQLSELREIGMKTARDAEANREPGRPVSAAQMNGYYKLTKAIRQIMVLEQETLGMREKRLERSLKSDAQWKKDQIRKSVEHSIALAKPEDDRETPKRLMSDLLDRNDLYDYACGNIRDIVAGICETLGVKADLSIWEEPHRDDIKLRPDYEWIIPANGDKPYTVVTTHSGMRSQQPYDSPHLDKQGTGPPRQV